MEIVLFKIRTRPDVDEEAYGAAYEQMLGIVAGIRGFVDIEAFTGEDGTEMAVARFEDPEALADWRAQPDHVTTQQRGREEFFDSYDITIATVNRHYDWAR